LNRHFTKNLRDHNDKKHRTNNSEFINLPKIVQTTHSRGHTYPGSRESLAIQKKLQGQAVLNPKGNEY